MLRNRLTGSTLITALLLLGGIGRAQDTPLDPHSSIAVNLPPDSPVTLMSVDMGESRASARGGAMVLDLHMALKLRNNSPHRIRSLTMIVSAQEVTPRGRGSWSPWLDVGPGDVFPLPLDTRRLRPPQPPRAPPPPLPLPATLLNPSSFSR